MTARFAFIVVRASCSAGNAERDFFFDTHGTAKGTSTKATIYVNLNQPLYVPGSPSPSPPP